MYKELIDANEKQSQMDPSSCSKLFHTFCVINNVLESIENQPKLTDQRYL